MITAGADLQVLVATRPVDFRKQADGLAAIVQAALGADPFICGGTDYVAAGPSNLWVQRSLRVCRHIMFDAFPVGAGCSCAPDWGERHARFLLCVSWSAQEAPQRGSRT